MAKATNPEVLRQLQMLGELGGKLQNLPKRLQYATRYHQIKRGQYLSFWRRKWLLDIYTQVQVRPGAKTVIRKCVQCGISEFLVLDTLFTTGELGLWTLYVLPTKVLRDSFVRLRIDPVIAASDFYMKLQAEAVGTVDGVGSKFFGKGAISFVGSNSDKEFISYPADRIVIDERDSCKEENLEMAPERYAGSRWKIFYSVGNPTIETRGISAEFADSQKKEWHIQCEHCNHWQPMDWFKNVVRQVSDYHYEHLDLGWTQGHRDLSALCVRCGKLLDRFGKGEWVAEHPDHDVNGYTISQLYSPNTTLEHVAFDKKEGFFKVLNDVGKLGRFYNAVLGLPFNPPGTSLSYDLLKFTCEKEYSSNSPAYHQATMGVDVGKVLNVVISDHVPADGKVYRRLLKAVTVNSFEDLDILMANYKISCCVVDSMPETREAKRFQQRHFGKVWLCQFYKTTNITELKLNDVERIVQVDRTQSIDSMVAQFMDGTRILPKNSEKLDYGVYYDHMLAPQRRLDETTGSYYWDEGSAADHYFMADHYDYVAKRLLDKGVNSCLALNSEYTPKGYILDDLKEQHERESMINWLFDRKPPPEKKEEIDEAKRKLEDKLKDLEDSKKS